MSVCRSSSRNRLRMQYGVDLLPAQEVSDDEVGGERPLAAVADERHVAAGGGVGCGAGDSSSAFGTQFRRGHRGGDRRGRADDCQRRSGRAAGQRRPRDRLGPVQH